MKYQKGKKYKITIKYDFEDEHKEEYEEYKKQCWDEDKEPVSFEKWLKSENEYGLKNYSSLVQDITLDDGFPSEAVQDIKCDISDRCMEEMKRGENNGIYEIEYTFKIPEDATDKDIQKIVDFQKSCSDCIVEEI